MEFFDKLGKKASEAYKITADKTGKIAKETKLKFKIGDLKTQINSVYEEIGKKVYENHIREEKIDIENEIEEQCTKIDVLSDEIDSLLKECLKLKDKKQCPNCYKEINKEDNFCPNCGEKQPEEPAKEVEIVDNIENSEGSADSKVEEIDTEEQENTEDVQMDEEENSEDEDLNS